jgi:orotate phosphoribosyltransferase
MRSDILDLVASRTGHFRLESGHHAERWLDLERLCMDVRAIERLAAELASLLAGHAFDIVCGPLVEGAFVALMVASKLAKPFVYTERITSDPPETLFSVRYEVPSSLRPGLRGKRIAIVNDFTSAGSAVRGTVTDLRACGGSVAAIGSLVVLGAEAAMFCERERLPLETLQTIPFEIWEPSACPLCAAGELLVDPLRDPVSSAIVTHPGAR